MNKIILIPVLTILSLLSSCKEQQTYTDDNQPRNASDSERFLIVDCLLPGQLRKLGQSATYLTARRPIKTSASDCEIRGGEYVAFDRSNYSTALKIWLPKALEGDAEAQAYVGEIYEKGLGLEADYPLALNWYIKAAQQGNTRAQLNLGYLYEKGLGVQADKNQAMKWYRKASGLAEKNLAYTFTAKSPPASSQRSEVRILKAALSTSQNESKQLQYKLEKTHKQMLVSQQKLQLSQSELTKTKLEKKQDSSDQPELSLRLKSKETSIINQIKLNQQLQSQYENDVSQYKLKLSETENRASQLLYDLRKNQSEKNAKQVQLLDIQRQLASTEKQLLNIKNTHKKEKNTLHKSELNQAQKLKLQIEVDNHQLNKVQKQLIAYQQEKNQQQQLIKKLELKNSHHKKKLQQLNKKLSSQNISQIEIQQLKDKLIKQSLSAQQAQDKLQSSKTQFNQIGQQYHLEEKLYNIKLKNLESERQRFESLYADSFRQSQSSQAVIKKLLDEKKQQWMAQQKTINNLVKEKKQLNQKLLSLKDTIAEEDNSRVPTIEIIDPVFAQLRGVPTVTLRSVVRQREITGRVTSAAGMLSLTINDEKSLLDQKGLFKQSIKLKQTENPVHVSAIDKKGNKTTLDFIISMGEAKRRNAIIFTEAEEKDDAGGWNSINFGDYYAIIIANNKYSKLPSLETPINDGTAIEKILREKYGFKTKVLLNGTRYEILSLLNEYRSKLTSNDNLLVYYAGHGELDRVNMRGHWLPVDSDADNTANWISTIALTDIFNSMSAKHLMVVADSCYSGAMTRSSLASLDAGKTHREKEQWLKAMLKARSRTILSSGGLKPVLDGGGGMHSVFAKAFIDSLENNNRLLEGQELYRKVSTKIVSVAADYGVEQVPEYAPMRHAGHEAGEFFFIPK